MLIFIKNNLFYKIRKDLSESDERKKGFFNESNLASFKNQISNIN